MKKNLALLLAVVLAITSMLGITAVADGAEATAPSQEVEYFNVSLRVGVTLLFAVPADGYTVNGDGTVDNLKLLAFEESKVAGVFNVADALASGEVIEASGKYTIGNKEYVIFAYTGLAANQMTETVYVRTLRTTKEGYRSYGDIYSYSVAEFVSRYNGNAATKNLISSMLAYGDAALDYKPNTGIKANFLPSEATNGLYKVSVNMMVDGKSAGTVVSQYAKAGELTLAAPHVDGADFVSWGTGVTEGKITVSGDVTVTANYESKSVFSSYDFEQYEDGGKTYNAVGNYIATDYSGNPTNNVSGSAVAPAGSYWKIGAALNLGNNWNATEASSAPHAYCYSKWQIVKDGDSQVIKFAHNGNGQTTFGAFVTTSLATTTGIGDTLNFSLELDVKPATDGSFPYTVLRVDRQGSATSNTANGSPDLIKLMPDGSVVLGGEAVEYGGLNTNVIVEKASATAYTKIGLYVDFSTGTLYGYANGTLTAVSAFPETLKPEHYLAGMDALKNTRFQIAMYGGYAASNWTTISGFPKALVDSGSFVATVAEEGKYVLDGNSYRVYVEETDAEATRYNITYTDSEAFRTAVADYINANQYFYYDNVKVSYGDAFSK